MWIFDQKTLAFMEVNDAAIERYGYSRDEFLQLTILDIRPPGDVPKLLRSAIHPATKGPSREEHWTHLTKHGALIPVSITSYEIIFHGRPCELVLARPLEK
jgi:PAS domain S-box-containing protein